MRPRPSPILGLAEDEASQVAFVLIRAMLAGQPAKADSVRDQR